MEISYQLSEIDLVAKQVLKCVTSKTLLFHGDMGVGKTTLIKAIVKALGFKNHVNSPTFSIINEYNIENELIYHFDLYRINDTDELYNLGVEDYLYSTHWKLIEWPKKIKPLLFDNYNEVFLSFDTVTRNLKIS